MTLPFGDVVLDHFRRPRRQGTLASPDVNVEGANPLCGDRIRLQLALDAARSRIDDARFTADACAICVAAASLLVGHVVGMRTSDAVALTSDEVLAWLEAPIPDVRRACALLPLDALRRGVHDWADGAPAPRASGSAAPRNSAAPEP